MAKLLRGNIRLVKGGVLLAGAYIFGMVFSWLLASTAIVKILTYVSWPGLKLAELFVHYLRADHGITWMAAWPPDFSGVIQSPLGAQAMSILTIGVLLNVVIFYIAGYVLAKRIK